MYHLWYLPPATNNSHHLLSQYLQCRVAVDYFLSEGKGQFKTDWNSVQKYHSRCSLQTAQVPVVEWLSPLTLLNTIKGYPTPPWALGSTWNFSYKKGNVYTISGTILSTPDTSSFLSLPNLTSTLFFKIITILPASVYLYFFCKLFYLGMLCLTSLLCQLFLVRQE